MQNQKPLIFDIKRHALDDGPGIRTVIFFKGCPLQCVWCHNPESIDPQNEIGFYPSECIFCRVCAKVCPTSALKIDTPGRIDRTICKRCGTCVEACPGHGLRSIGRFYEVDELLDIILRDRIYYQISGGGVTLSGGEPTLYMDYASQVLGQLKKNKINTVIETCGFFDYSEFDAKLLEYLDLILFDIKLADKALHRKYTGRENVVILKNLARLARERPDNVIPRIPLIPDITTSPENLKQIVAIFKEMGINRCWLLPYNPLGFSKLVAIGKPAVNMPERRLSEEEMSRIMDIFSGIELVEL